MREEREKGIEERREGKGDRGEKRGKKGENKGENSKKKIGGRFVGRVEENMRKKEERRE